MSQDSNIKHPASTPEVSNMLGLNKTGDAGHASAVSTTPVAPSDLPISNLPIAHDLHAAASSSHDSHASTGELLSLEEKQAAQPTYLKIIKTALPYVVVFAVGIFLYYFFFSTVNFGDVFKSTPKASAPQETAIQALEKQDLTSYYSWINGFYYSVNDPKITDPEADNSGNGLSNFQKYLLNLNPKSYDTLGLGMADSQAISQGINPLSDRPLTDAQKAIVDKYLDMEVVMNRLTLARMQNQGAVAGAAINQNNQPIIPVGNTVGNNNNNYPTPTPTQTQTQNPYQAPQTGANLNNPNTVAAAMQDNSVDINTNIPGKLEIPSLKVTVPIMWTQDPKNFDKDLQVGVVHYPGTAMPGQIGTTYIAGHSSNYAWAKGDYNHVFTHLGDLPNNSSFQITVTDKNGKLVVYHYVVTSSKQYTPTDQAQFANTGKSTVALSTCWPVGSTAKRLVLFGELTQVEK